MFPIFLQTLNIRVLTFDYFKIMTANSKNLELFIFALFKIKISRTKEFKEPHPHPKYTTLYQYILTFQCQKAQKMANRVGLLNNEVLLWWFMKDCSALQGKKYKTRVSSQVMYFLPGHTLGPLKKHFTVYTYAPLRNDL